MAVRIAIFTASMVLAIMIFIMLTDGIYKATMIDWPHYILAFALAVLLEFIILPRLPKEGPSSKSTPDTLQK
jgi:hypothetical protein